MAKRCAPCFMCDELIEPSTFGPGHLKKKHQLHSRIIPYNNKTLTPMISHLELRQIIEAAFLPLQCQCTIGADGFMTVKVTGPQSEQLYLLATGINSALLVNMRTISNQIAELRIEMRANRDGRRCTNG